MPPPVCSDEQVNRPTWMAPSFFSHPMLVDT